VTKNTTMLEIDKDPSPPRSPVDDILTKG